MEQNGKLVFPPFCYEYVVRIEWISAFTFSFHVSIYLFLIFSISTEEEPARGLRSFTRDPSQLQGSILQTSLKKSPLGFGFTIIGGDRPDEFLQVKNVLPDGPAAHDNKIAPGNLPHNRDSVLFVFDMSYLAIKILDWSSLPCKTILFGFNVLYQHKVSYNCKVDENMCFKIKKKNWKLFHLYSLQSLPIFHRKMTQA